MSGAFEHHWPSTKAFSVYSVLSRAKRDLSAAEIMHYLQSNWSTHVDSEYVASGAVFLILRGFAHDENGLLRLQHRKPDGSGRTIMRAHGDQEIVYAESA